MAPTRTPRTRPLGWLLALAWPLACTAGPPGPVDIDAKDAQLGLILQLVAAHGGANLIPHPHIATQSFTFATKQTSRAGTVRWLCWPPGPARRNPA